MTTQPGQLVIPAKEPLVYISFSAEITPHTTESLIATAATCANAGVGEVYLLLSTPGGNVREGIALYNTLRAMPFKLTVHNVGSVNSIGNAIFLAGQKRYASPESTFMFHGVGMNAKDGQRLEEKNLKETLDSILADQKRIGAIISKHTKLTETEVAELFLSQQTKDATYAVGNGIVDEVRDVKIAYGKPVVSLVFRRQGV